MTHSIAQLLKYVPFLEEKKDLLARKINQLETLKTTTKVLSSNADTKVVEQTEFTLNIKEVTGEYDKVCKELRIVKDEIERLNHWTTTEITLNY